MALTPERILEMAGLAPDRKVCASTCMTAKFEKKPCECYPTSANRSEVVAIARAIEAEVRKQDDALIMQLAEALERARTIILGDRQRLTAEDVLAMFDATCAARARMEARYD